MASPKKCTTHVFRLIEIIIIIIHTHESWPHVAKLVSHLHRVLANAAHQQLRVGLALAARGPLHVAGVAELLVEDARKLGRFVTVPLRLELVQAEVARVDEAEPGGLVVGGQLDGHVSGRPVVADGERVLVDEADAEAGCRHGWVVAKFLKENGYSRMTSSFNVAFGKKSHKKLIFCVYLQQCLYLHHFVHF